MRTRAKEKLIRDWERLDTEAQKLVGKGHFAIGIHRTGFNQMVYSIWWYGERCGTTPRKAIAALRRAVEGK